MFLLMFESLNNLLVGVACVVPHTKPHKEVYTKTITPFR